MFIQLKSVALLGCIKPEKYGETLARLSDLANDDQKFEVIPSPCLELGRVSAHDTSPVARNFHGGGAVLLQGLDKAQHSVVAQYSQYSEGLQGHWRAEVVFQAGVHKERNLEHSGHHASC